MRTRAALFLATATAALAFALPAQAGQPGGWSEPTAALAKVETARSLLGGGSLADAVRATASLVDATIPDLNVPAPSGADAALLVGLDPQLARPVGRLLAAIREAGRITAGVVRDPEPTDRGALFRAALLLARTIDATLPELRAAAALTQLAGTTDAACDVADVPPALCIGGTYSSTYTADYALHIDQGGDDTYTNSAGGADPAASPLRLPVAVVIDLGGDDRYTTVNPTPSGSRVSIGSGMMGGTGILLDAAGDDTYLTTHAPVAPGASPRTISSQGVGSTGNGILADLAGDDSYTVSNTAASDYVVSRQAYASGGLGVLLDRSGGDDTYLVEARASSWVDTASPPKVHPGAGSTQAFATAALGGAALFADDGGTDSQTALAASATVAPDDPRPQAAGAESSVSAFGWANMGGAAVIAGVGDTTRIATAETSAPQAPAASVTGFGNTFQFAALADEGGDDVYRATAVSEARRTAAIADGCNCSGLTASATAGAATVSAGAWGSGAGSALLLDQAGDDTYSAAAISSAQVAARDDRTEPDPFGGVKGTATSAAASVTAWGYGQVSGRGVLRDSAGNDMYEARASSTASAEASAYLPEYPATHPIEGHAIAGNVLGRSQAVGSLGGIGELIDLGGGDSYSSTNVSTAVASPATEQRVGTAVSSVQGSSEDQAGVSGVGGVALFFDDAGPADSFTATPPDPTASGTRGQGVWLDAGPGAGAGTNQ